MKMHTVREKGICSPQGRRQVSELSKQNEGTRHQRVSNNELWKSGGQAPQTHDESGIGPNGRSNPSLSMTKNGQINNAVFQRLIITQKIETEPRLNTFSSVIFLRRWYKNQHANLHDQGIAEASLNSMQISVLAEAARFNPEVHSSDFTSTSIRAAEYRTRRQNPERHSHLLYINLSAIRFDTAILCFTKKSWLAEMRPQKRTAFGNLETASKTSKEQYKGNPKEEGVTSILGKYSECLHDISAKIPCFSSSDGGRAPGKSQQQSSVGCFCGDVSINTPCGGANRSAPPPLVVRGRRAVRQTWNTMSGWGDVI
ncbi:hypothetical protein CYLTODRAFT_442417 [Cylindrobasidium torrendii FP15055 ss-10]|uniref:Uncharacterized protein n=1 Tax=Cylindrobasidium torrendii FP15055 ss-10 TaxID=1314674 RepID=A0A0D7BGS6_9AGAR|nr:hypothetical protein CYLTODRAFT_442417 [Cylindrobasidium torrendii FP15055 ss-10]